MTEPAFRVADLHVSLERSGVRHDVLRGIDLDVQAGEIVALVGESGSGKSVLALTAMRLLPEDSAPRVSGTVRIARTDMLAASPAQLRAVRRRELGVVFQDPMTSLNPTMRIGRQITEKAGDREDAVRLMASMGIADAPRRFTVYPHELSGGLRQRVMAAIAISGRPSLLIADEPTTALDVTVQAQVLALLRELRDEYGCSILFITHDLAVAARLADRIAVLYAGRIAEIGPTAQILERPSHPYTAGLLRSRLSLATPRGVVLATLPAETGTPRERTVGCAYRTRCPLALPRCAEEQPPREPVGEGSRACWRPVEDVRRMSVGGREAAPMPGGSGRGELAVRVSGLRTVYGRGRRRREALRGLDLELRQGEAVSVVGESGSGKSTLLRAIAGLAPVTSGTVALGPGGAQMVFQDAGSSLTPWLTVGELLRERLTRSGLDRRTADLRIAESLEAIGLPAAVADQRPGRLSGGQRQRVTLVRATIVPPAVLLCDEPTSALDASLAATVLNLIRELRARLGMTVLFVTHDLAVARLMGERLVVMSDGEIVESGPVDEVVSRPSQEYTRSLLAAVPELATAGPPGGDA
jgi:peptide/nickel transport system ATP-binding protein